jgi:hypothetical protein
MQAACLVQERAAVEEVPWEEGIMRRDRGRSTTGRDEFLLRAWGICLVAGNRAEAKSTAKHEVIGMAVHGPTPPRCCFRGQSQARPRMLTTGCWRAAPTGKCATGRSAQHAFILRFPRQA